VSLGIERVRACSHQRASLLFVYDPKTTVVVTAVLSLLINVAVVWDSWRDADRRMVLALLLPALAGVVVGVEVLRLVDPEYIRLTVSLVVVFRHCSSCGR
jgi:uncharacterized membrane protein YfcA